MSENPKSGKKLTMGKVCLILAALLVAAVILCVVGFGRLGSVRKDLTAADAGKTEAEALAEQYRQQIEKDAGEAGNTIAALNEEVAGLEKTVSEKEAELKESAAALEKAMLDLDAEKAAAAEKQAALEKELLELNEKIGALEAARAEWEKSAAEKQAELDRLLEEFETQKAAAEKATAEAAVTIAALEE